MKLIIKNLKQIEHNVEVSSDNITVKQLKNEIEKVHGFDSNQLKLLFKGVVLDDSKKLQEYNITEGSGLIMMNTKVKPKNIPQGQNNQQSIEQKQTENKPIENKPIENKPVENKSNEPNYTEQINNLLNMGCEKSKAEAAIKAAKGNLELAIDFYFNGIPENNENMLDFEDMGGYDQVGENENQTENDPIKNIASIAKIVCQNNPAALTPLLENIKQQNPDLFNLIKENEEDFKRYLESPVTDEDLTNFRNFQHEMGLGGIGGENEEEEEQQHQGGVQINLTPEEEEAVKRLKELGNFNESDVLQAYFACEKNEEMAANYLFEQKMRDDDEMFGAHSHNNQNNNNQNNNQGGQ